MSDARPAAYALRGARFLRLRLLSARALEALGALVRARCEYMLVRSGCAPRRSATYRLSPAARLQLRQLGTVRGLAARLGDARVAALAERG